MPIYTYECDTCKRQFESLERSEVMELPCFGAVMEATDVPGEYFETQCSGTMRRIPSLPAPAQFNCPMPTYQRPKT